MKKLLETLWLVWMLMWSPSANAWVDTTRVETNKNLVETMVQEQTTSDNDEQTITLEEAQKLQEQQKLIEEIMGDEKIQELINEYWEEEVEKMVKDIITNKNTVKILKKALDDKKIQKALQEWDEEYVTWKLQKLCRHYYGLKYVWELGRNAFVILSVIFFWKKLLEAILGYNIVIWRRR